MSTVTKEALIRNKNEGRKQVRSPTHISMVGTFFRCLRVRHRQRQCQRQRRAWIRKLTRSWSLNYTLLIIRNSWWQQLSRVLHTGLLHKYCSRITSSIIFCQMTILPIRTRNIVLWFDLWYHLIHQFGLSHNMYAWTSRDTIFFKRRKYICQVSLPQSTVSWK